jgi:hypothetical protein
VRRTGCGSRLLKPHQSVPHAGQSGPHPDNWISEISLPLFKARNLACSVLRNFPRDFSFLLCAKSNTEPQLSNSSPMELDQNPRLVLFKERWGSSVRSSGLVLLGGGKLGPKISCRSPAWARPGEISAIGQPAADCQVRARRNIRRSATPAPR